MREAGGRNAEGLRFRLVGGDFPGIVGVVEAFPAPLQ